MIRLSKNFELQATQYASQGNAILGIRDSGKSYTAMKVAEELMTAGIPIIVFDPTGIWKNLKIGVNGHQGFQVVVAGGNEPDLNLTVESTPDIIRAAIKENVSLIIDLYSRELSNKSTWIKIVETSINILCYENEGHGLRHIFIEEAAEFIPQRLQPQHSKVYSEIERLARIGRNFGLGYTIINQRAEEVNKAILEIAEMSLLHKQVGKNSLLSIQTWLKVQQLEDTEKVIKSLVNLKQGECWALGKEAQPVQIKVDRKKTFHPDRKKATKAEPSKSTRADVTQFIARMNANLNIKKADIKPGKELHEYRLQQMVTDLEKANQQLAAEAAKAKNELLRVNAEIRKAAGLIVQKITPVLKDHIEQILMSLPAATPEFKIGEWDMTSMPVAVIQGGTISKYEGPSLSVINESDRSIGKCELAILSVLVQRTGVETTKDQLSVLSGYSIKSSGFINALSSLRTKGYIEGRHATGDRIMATDSGIKFIWEIQKGKIETVPKGMDLVNYWCNKLGKAEATILKCIIDQTFQVDQRGRTFTKAQISRMSGYSDTSSGFINALSKLRTLKLIEGYSQMKAADIFFE